MHGQYVIYYNERLSWTSFPSYAYQYAYNELCEFEVYGMNSYLIGLISDYYLMIKVVFENVYK